MKMKALLFVLLITNIVHDAFAQVNQNQTTQVQLLKEISQKGTKLFVQSNCWDDNQFNQVLLTELGGRGIWKIVNNANDADLILRVNAWSRPQVYGIVYETYALIYDNAEHLLYKSDIYLGQPTAFNGYDPRKASIKNLINDGLIKEIPKSKWIYREPLDFLGCSKIATDKYKSSEDYFWEGLDYYNQYNYKEAIKLFTYALSLNPENAYTYKFMAIAFFNLSKYRDARANIIKAMKLDPTNRQNDTTYYNIMVGKNDKFMKVWGPGGTMDRVNGAINAVGQVVNSAANAKMTTTSVSSNIEQNTKETTHTGTKQRICTFCNGTGSNPAKEYPAEFGLGHSYNDTPCNICGSYMNHFHKRCPSCAGKGYKIVSTN